MKRLTLILCFIVSISSAYGQQFLWSTMQDSTIEYVSLENVSNKVLEFYDHYKFYYDGSGYSKEGFFKLFENSQSFKNSNKSQWQGLKKKILTISNPSVLAFKSNSGLGSEVLVLCISKDNVNMVGFNSNFEEGALLTYTTEREKFAKWFGSLLE